MVERGKVFDQENSERNTKKSSVETDRRLVAEMAKGTAEEAQKSLREDSANLKKVRAEIKVGGDYKPVTKQEQILADQNHREEQIGNNPVRQERRNKGFMDNLKGSWPARKVMLWASIFGIGTAGGVGLSTVEPVQKEFDSGVSIAKTSGEKVAETASWPADRTKEFVDETARKADETASWAAERTKEFVSGKNGPEEQAAKQNKATAVAIETKEQNSKINEYLVKNPNATEEEIDSFVNNSRES